MWPDQLSKPGPLTYESGALSTVLRGPVFRKGKTPTMADFHRTDLVICTHPCFISEKSLFYTRINMVTHMLFGTYSCLVSFC